MDGKRDSITTQRTGCPADDAFIGKVRGKEVRKLNEESE
jgi:hypothetical protein